MKHLCPPLIQDSDDLERSLQVRGQPGPLSRAQRIVSVARRQQQQQFLLLLLGLGEGQRQQQGGQQQQQVRDGAAAVVFLGSAVVVVAVVVIFAVAVVVGHGLRNSGVSRIERCISVSPLLISALTP